MNKKVFTLLPIFSMFALASCGGSTPGPTPTDACKLTYHFNNASSGSEQTYVETYEKNAKPKRPAWVPTYTGHTFDDWYKSTATGAEKFDFSKPLTATDTPVYAQWSVTPEPSEKSIQPGNDAFKAAINLAFDKDYVTNKYVGGTVTATTAASSDDYPITGVTEDGVGTGKWKFVITGFGIQQDLLNAARIDELMTATTRTIYYIGDSYQTGVITGFSFILDSCTFRYNNHCVLTSYNDPTFGAETFTYTLNPTPSNS